MFQNKEDYLFAFCIVDREFDKCQNYGLFECYPGVCIDESFDYHCNCSGTGFLQISAELSIYETPACEGKKAALRNKYVVNTLEV